MQVSKWGNSLAVRLPAKLVQELGLKEGDEIEIRRAPDQGVLEIARKDSKEEIFARLRQLRGTMPADYKFNRDELYERRSDDTD